MVREGGVESAFSYGTEEEAERVKRRLQKKFADASAKTVGQALIEYETYLKTEKQNKPESVRTTGHRLRAFFSDEEVPLIAITPKGAGHLYKDLTERQTPDTHRNTLAEARTFAKWCLKRGIIQVDFLAGIEGMGRRRKGKVQLRVDEARRWLATALALAAEGDAGAVAALLTLLLGMRAGEVISREVRDLDDRGRLLWIPASKTEAGRRTLEVPAVLRESLLGLCEAKPRTARLFGRHWRDWPREQVQRICQLAGVPKVTAHGMRGLHATLALSAGASGHVVAASLGHESVTTTLNSYADRQVLDQAAKAKVVGHLMEEVGG